MKTRDDDGPMWTGFLFGLGFWIAGALVSAVGAALSYAAFVSLVSSQVQAPHMMRHSAERPGPSVQRETVTVPPRSVEACKALTGGQINEDFAQCRQGYTETR